MDNLANKSVKKSSNLDLDFSLSVNKTLEDNLIIPPPLKRQVDLLYKPEESFDESFPLERNNKKNYKPSSLSKYITCSAFDEALEAANESGIDVTELLDKYDEAELIEIINERIEESNSCRALALEEFLTKAVELEINTEIVLDNAQELGISFNDALQIAILEAENYINQKSNIIDYSKGVLEHKNSAPQPLLTRGSPISYHIDIDNLPSTSINQLDELHKMQLAELLSNRIDESTAPIIAEVKFENSLSGNFIPKPDTCTNIGENGSVAEHIEQENHL